MQATARRPSIVSAMSSLAVARPESFGAKRIPSHAANMTERQTSPNHLHHMKQKNTSIVIQVLVLILLSLAAVPSSFSKTLVENGDFSQRDTEGNPKNWNIWGKLVSSDAKSGMSFLRVTGTGADSGNLAPAGGWQSVPVPEKKKQLTLSARVRCPDFSKRPGRPDDHYEIYLQAKFAGGRQVYFGSSKIHTVERSWKRLEFTAKIPDGATELVVLFNIGGLGTLDITDVKLEAR